MSESSSISSANGSGEIPAWMQTISEDTFYNTTHETESRGAEAESGGDKAKSEGDEGRPRFSTRSSVKPTARNNSPAASKGKRRSLSLQDKLALSMAKLEDIPSPEPDLQPTVVGAVRADLDKQLETVVAVLNTRYDKKVSRTLILEYSLQRTLTNLREDDEDSRLVEWLDSVLSPT